MKIRLSIVDDHPLAVNGIKSMLANYTQIDIVDTYHSGGALLEGLTLNQPDVLLLDILLPDKSGKDLAPIISKTYPDIRIVALTSLDAPAMVKSMMNRGCIGYLLKDTDEKTMIDAIEHAYRGEEFIEPSLKAHMIKNMLKFRQQNTHTIPELTSREKEVLKLILTEHNTQQIADKLFISFRTVENHRYNLHQKLDVKNTVGLIRVAITMGLIE